MDRRSVRTGVRVVLVRPAGDSPHLPQVGCVGVLASSGYEALGKVDARGRSFPGVIIRADVSFPERGTFSLPISCLEALDG